MMTIDEAIEHAKKVARTCDDSQCAADHMQLAEWLRKARGAEKAASWYTKKIRELEEERDMYRDFVGCISREHSQTLVELSGAYFACDQLKEENAKLRKELEAVGTAAYLYGRKDPQEENEKLRELVRELYEDQCCEGDQWKYRDRLRELGIEVDE